MTVSVEYEKVEPYRIHFMLLLTSVGYSLPLSQVHAGDSLTKYCQMR